MELIAITVITSLKFVDCRFCFRKYSVLRFFTNRIDGTLHRFATANNRIKTPACENVVQQKKQLTLYAGQSHLYVDLFDQDRPCFPVRTLVKTLLYFSTFCIKEKTLTWFQLFMHCTSEKKGFHS